jgi:hypothetical protein
LNIVKNAGVMKKQHAIQLIQYSEKIWDKILLNRISEKDLYEIYCIVIKDYANTSSVKTKLTKIIYKIEDFNYLKEMCLITRDFSLVNEILPKISSQSLLNTLKKERPDLEVHIKSRQRMNPNSILFIDDD